MTSSYLRSRVGRIVTFTRGRRRFTVPYKRGEEEVGSSNPFGRVMTDPSKSQESWSPDRGSLELRYSLTGRVLRSRELCEPFSGSGLPCSDRVTVSHSTTVTPLDLSGVP